eukprot:TRINITY_DN3797_c0_g1_i1.p1 TRINITY_DN3797_c0_g1~~TRINITY_DN3797_c0_g1_i1.p1  ORF type:complete len:385 (-),score=114.65 TRINITY_DN3797_c0_g1_i1:533-1687(-)
MLGKKIYIFGGYNRSNEAYFNTLFSFDSESLTWTLIEPRGNPPEKRCGHTASVIDGKLFVFGGRVKVKLGDSLFASSSVEYRNDLHCYDPATNEWLRYEPRGIAPAGRAMHTATVVGRKIYIFGGANSTGTRDDSSGFCDLFELDVDTMTWTECETKSTPPLPCYGHSATLYADNKILFFGGKGYKTLNSIHVLDLKSMEWKQVAYAGNTLQCRWGHSATLHGTRLLLYGGRDNDIYLNTIEIIDTATQLIELKPEELAKEEIKRKREEENKERETIGNLQSAVYDLQQMMSAIGGEIMRNKQVIHEANQILQQLRAENVNLRSKLGVSTASTIPSTTNYGSYSGSSTHSSSVTDYYASLQAEYSLKSTQEDGDIVLDKKSQEF